ncbi:small G protein signaling modulator 1 isoform X4 [Notothenia coriiceps]|uniref:Small G protein signaling modulator 1 isoform X4 n=1 Tax=Notothenia coriiceps TaxID=8208 RepID=A0A6I9MJ16_9TELE|nr:PREDICTED: small G protein signaling modulator 1 isoform X4 [Notothenia coriiceps]
MATIMAEAETRQRLLRTVKKEVKQIMEEAVTRKFVHEDSSHIVSFCAAVEACVLHGLKRRAAGFLRSNKIAALFMKVGKSFVPAEDLCRKAQELEQVMETKRSQSMQSQDGLRKMPRLPSLSPQGVKNLWIRTALFEKVLDKIVLYLVENSSKYYEKEAVLMDNVDGPILASLLVGPCALEYSKMKTADHFWTDPSADELVQRHRIHGGHCRQDSPTKRPALCIQKRHSSSSMDERPSPSPSAREYVESLHQNSRVTLLFGKNNVLVQPRDDMEAIPGYLSMHQNADLMTLKWTPNQLMNGSVGDLDYECSVYWDYAMTIPLGEIVYLHCHQQVDSGGTVVLVSQDGIQRPPLRFPRGGHLLQFLSCLENGLLPHGQLDPPLWSQRGKGKVFPKLRNRVPQGSGSSDSVSDKEEDEATDYVFRILFPNSHSEFVTVTHAPHLTSSLSLPLSGSSPFKTGILVVPKRSCSCPEDPPTLTGSSLTPPDLDQGATMWHPTLRKSSCSSCSHGSFSDGATPKGCNHERAPLKMLCDNMKNQIISRAFYGWLAYCRHLSTVRTHLSALVNHTIVAPDVPCDAYKGLTTDVWQTFLQDCTAYEEKDLLRLVYYGGVEASLRKEVWPFLLGHYQFGMSEAERKEVDEQVRVCYQQTMSEWLGCEEIVRQREKEQHAAAIAKCSSAASMDSPSQKMMSHHNSSVSNESQSSQSSDRQSLARLQSDSSSSTQQELLDLYTLNLHRIEKDVQRCDRNYWYFTPANLEKLRNIMCSYIWRHLDIGYVQGMCDLLAPLLVILDDEAMAFSCFTELMKRMNQNFPHGGAMDTHFANMRSLIQILDSEMFELMHQNGDYTHFYFCYRWFLLDFKRELVYDDVFAVWETIWAAKYASSSHFVLFIALALVEIYRDIILENNMDFTEIIKFFNEMAEHHNTKQILTMARDLVCKVQILIENK